MVVIFRSHRSLIRCLTTSQVACGLEEFFPPGVLEKGELAPETVQTGISLLINVLMSFAFISLVVKYIMSLVGGPEGEVFNGVWIKRSGVRTLCS